MVKDKIRELIKSGIKKLQQNGELPDFEVPAVISIDYPQSDKYGDYSSNIAMQLAGKMGQSPMEIGQKITAELKKTANKQEMFEGIELAAPGFINFTLSPNWLSGAITLINKKAGDFGKSNFGHGKKIQVEFVSANPTGPLTAGNGRGAFIGDTLSRVLLNSGFRVEKEYYINDSGKQVDILGESVTRRYLQQQGIKVPYPEYCYQGEYITELAKTFRMNNYTLKNGQKINEIKDKIKVTILEKMIKQIRKLLTDKLGIDYDLWFSERSLHESGEFDRVIDKLKEKGLTYENEGALWFKSSLYGDQKDRVLIKQDKAATYFATDIAHHVNNYSRNSFKINILGADHHGEVPSMLAAMKALGHENKLKVILVQFVRLIEGGFEIKMSKRSGNFITLEELIDDIGLDVARFFFLMYASGSHMDFDLSLARKKSEKNPVFYVQYAHARICSIMEKLKIMAEEIKPRNLKNSGITLRHPAELALIKELVKMPDLLEEVSSSYETHRIPFYAIEIARKFHNFYAQCRVIEGDEVVEERKQLVLATKVVLKNTLDLMRVTAPDKM